MCMYGRDMNLNRGECDFGEIINNLKWRHSTIKNMIDWRRFEAGS